MRVSTNITVTVTAKLSGGERPEYRATGGHVIVEQVIAEFSYPRGRLEYLLVSGHLRHRPAKAVQDVYVGGWVPEEFRALVRDLSRSSDARLLSGNI